MQQPFETALLGHPAARHQPPSRAERIARVQHAAAQATRMKRALARLRAALSVEAAARGLSRPF